MKLPNVAEDIFGSLDWCTTSSVNDAMFRFWKDDESCDERPLTTEELSSPYFPFDRSTEEYILVQPFGALHPDTGDRISTTRRVRNGCCVRELLEQVYEMTVKDGPFATADRVFFEGFDKKKDGHDSILTVLLGS